MVTLRDYQQRAVDGIFDWIGGRKGNPICVMPTGSGKSHVIASVVKRALAEDPACRVLMLSHVKELIEQNESKMLEHWPEAPVGVYSSGLGRRDLTQLITFATYQSVMRRTAELGHVDFIIVDECHRINNAPSGGYRKMIAALKEKNENLRVIGFTATPYRLGQGMLFDGDDALFSEPLIEPVQILDLVQAGYLAELSNKAPAVRFSDRGVKKRGGEYQEKDLQRAVSEQLSGDDTVKELLKWGAHRKSWIVFCAGVLHTEQIAEALNDAGIKTKTVLGTTPAQERAESIELFKKGEIECIANSDVLTTGFDAPNVDLVAMLRPTLSAALYMQMVGRGFRIAPEKEDCLILDFAGNIARHGPVTNVITPGRAKKTDKEPPSKTCPDCAEIVAASTKICPSCGHVFVSKRVVVLDDRPETSIDILARDPGVPRQVLRWRWLPYVSKAGNTMIVVDYYVEGERWPIREYFTVTYPGVGGRAARNRMIAIAQGAGNNAAVGWLHDNLSNLTADRLGWLAGHMTRLDPPDVITVTKDNKYWRVLAREWRDDKETA